MEKLKRSALLLLVFSFLISGSQTDEQNAQEQFQIVIDKINSLTDCRVIFREYTSAGPRAELFGRLRVEGKYLHSPKLYYQRRLEAEFNYKEQATAGFQEIYRSDTDLIELLMPGALRALGIVRIFPEDPKACGMQGQSLKKSAPWDEMEELKEMAKLGKITLQREKRAGQEFLLFEIIQNPGTYYRGGINRVKLWVDPNNLLPVRIEKYAPGRTEAVSWKEFEIFEINLGLTPAQIKFEGFKSPFSLISTPRAEEVEPLLKPILRSKLPEPAPDPQTILAKFNQAVNAINSYRADLGMRFRYHRLRLYREDRFAYHRDPYWFTLATTAQKANYLLLNHSAGAVLWLDPKDNNFHLIGGGVQKILGEQIFSRNDYKFYSPLGDNPYEMDFVKLQAMIKNDFTNQRAESWTVEYQDKKMWELKLVRTGETPARHPGKINLVIDPELNLPRVIELSGYDDPKAIMAMTIDNLKFNVSLKPGEARF